MKNQRRNIELLLIAIIFAVVVGVAFVIALATPNKEAESEDSTSENSSNTEESHESSTTNTPIQAIHEPDTNSTEEAPRPVKTVINTVPFTSQAPTGTWSDDRQQNACEEASVLMAMWWLQGKEPTSLKDAEEQILTIASFEEKNFGTSNDTDPTDTVKRIFNGYFYSEKAKVVESISVEDIIQEIMKGNLVIVPMNGAQLANPHYTAPGPERHMLLIVGYDAKTHEFVTNDSGTKFGSGYRYPEEKVFAAIREYPTGEHLPITGAIKKSMIVISK